jgi:TRAP-type C4-dicarboxylate transport system permease small subunit
LNIEHYIINNEMVKLFNKSMFLLELFSGYVIFALSFVVVLNVILRTAANMPMLGVSEAVKFTTLLCVCAALPKFTIEEKHTEVTFFADKLSETAKKYLATIMRLVSVGFFSVFTWQMFADIIGSDNVRVTDYFHIPYSVFSGAIAICFLLMTIALIVQLIAMIAGIKTTGSAG